MLKVGVDEIVHLWRDVADPCSALRIEGKAPSIAMTPSGDHEGGQVELGDQHPEKSPISAPASDSSAIATGIEKSCSARRRMMPGKADQEPTARSMPPVRTTKVMRVARPPVTTDWSRNREIVGRKKVRRKQRQRDRDDDRQRQHPESSGAERTPNPAPGSLELELGGDGADRFRGSLGHRVARKRS